MPAHATVTVYLEAGSKRVFAGALEWPGWCRRGRDEDEALEALIAYGPRYRAALGRAAGGFTAPSDRSSIDVVEKLKGNATTDFGAPGVAPRADERPLSNEALKRQTTLLRACWRAFDRAAEAASDAVLRKGPRGGGRDLDSIVSHVLEADGAYLSRLGGSFRPPTDAVAESQKDGLRRAFLQALRARAHGEPLPQSRRTKTTWTPRYAVRRSAWHSLDHAWEIEDRA